MTGREYSFLLTSLPLFSWHLRRALLLPSSQHGTDASLQAEKVARASERVEPSVTARFFVTTSKVSQSLRSVVSLVVVVSSVSQLVSSSSCRAICLALTRLISDLRRDPWCSQDLPRGCHSRCSHIHRTRQAQDRHLSRCCLCPEATRPHSVRFRWLDGFGFHGSSMSLMNFFHGLRAGRRVLLGWVYLADYGVYCIIRNMGFCGMVDSP